MGSKGSSHTRTHETGDRIVDVAPELCPFHVLPVPAALAEILGYLGDAPVVERILKRLRHRLVLLFRKDKAVVAEYVDSEFSLVGACKHALEGFVHVETGDTFGKRIGNHGSGAVADHAVGLVAAKLPDRKLPGFVVYRQHRLDEVDGALSFYDVEKRMQGAVGVPE